MCNCGCNTCETKKPALMLNESLAPRDILSEGLKHHLDAKKPLTEHLYRAGSTNYFNLWAEARSMYSRGILEITNEDDLAVLTETNLGYFGMFEGKKVPLDFPMLDEQGADTAWEDGEGNKVTLQDILDMTKNVPQKDYPTEKLAKIVLNWDDNPEEIERIDQVEISKQYPILIMADEAGKIQWILDGNHRAQKSLRSKSKTIPAKIIKPSMLDAKSKKVLLGVVDENVLNESYDYDEVAQSEFGMDYDQLGSGEKEWVRDEIDNMSMNESTSKKHEYIVTKDDWKKSKFPFDKLKNSEFKIKISGEGEYQKYMFFWKDDGGKDFEWERGNMKRQLRSALTAIAKIKLPINTSESINESKIPTQDQVDKFFALTQNEMHYLNSKPVMGQEKTFNKMEVEPWDEYDLSNWNALVGKAKFKGQVNESDSNYPDFDLNKNIRYQDTSISSGMWRYTGKEQGGKGVYRNLNNDQILGFDKSDFDIFKNHLSSHFDISESLNEKLKGIDGKACWKGYKLSGTKKKNGKTVDNCVPMEEVLKEKEGVPHYTKDGKEWKGKLHKMPDGSLMSGNPHDKNGSGPNGESEKLYHKEDLNEVKKKNTKKLNKPTRDSSGGKAYKVYVKDPKTGNIKTVRFGSGGLRAKINDKKARNAFAARHKCSTKKDKTKAGYWSCRLPRYAKLLGLKSNFSGFW